MKTLSKQAMNCTIALLCSIFLFSSCASIVTKTKYPLLVNSEPDGATLVITDKKGREIYSGNTPATLTLKSSNGFFSKADYSVRISYPGYDDKIVSVSSKIKGWYFANLLLSPVGLLGMLVIDPATGAMWKLDTKHINVSLSPTMHSDNSELRILDIKDIPEDWKSHLVSLEE